MSESSLSFHVNGKRVCVKNPDPKTLLGDFLKEEMGLKGLQMPCKQGGCGACTVVISFDATAHENVCSCLMPLYSVDGMHLTTIEGVGSLKTGLPSLYSKLLWIIMVPSVDSALLGCSGVQTLKEKPQKSPLQTSESEDMEIVEYQEEEDHQPSCARGGPIFVPNLIGPLTSIQEFKFSIIQGLHALEAELFMDSTTEFDDELSVDELKVLSEEELVDKAFKEACKDTELIESSLQIPEDNTNEMQENGCQMPNNEIACLENSRNESNTTKSHESLNEARLRVHSGNSLENMDQQGSKKRKRKGRTFDKDNHSVELESVYMERVEELAKIKQKQDEDKAAARLHSFNANTVAGTISAAEKVEKMRSLRFISSAMKVKSSSTHEYVPMNNPETVLSIEIYHNTKTQKKTQEFLVSGRQTLSEFRDKIYCMTDQLMQKAGQHDPSGYFLIEDVFCNDLRDPAAIDYSEPIFNWLRNRKEEALERWECITISGDPQKKNKALFGSETIAALPQFKASEMHKTRFCDLRFRLGSGYLYCHQGDCRHIMVIRDMRLIHPDDVQNQATYPIVTFQLQARWRKCSVCRTFRATKVTVDDKWAEDNPCYFCESCYFLLHYSEDGSLLYNEFEVYDYHLEV